MNAPSTTWFKNFWWTSDRLDSDVLFTGCTIPGEFLEKCFWLSFLREKPNLYTSNPFCEPNQFLKSGNDWGTPFRTKILFQTQSPTLLSSRLFVSLLCSAAIPLITSHRLAEWTQSEDKFPHEIIGGFPEAQRPTQADRQVTHRVKYVVIQSDFCGNLYKAMTVSLRRNSLNERSTSTLRIQIDLKILLLQIL